MSNKLSNKLKKFIIQIKKTFRNQDETARRDTRRHLRRQIQDKYSYKRKIEASLASSNCREEWQGIKTMTNVPYKDRGKPKLVLDRSEELEMENQLNTFFFYF